jgi:hypothetical protein
MIPSIATTTETIARLARQPSRLRLLKLRRTTASRGCASRSSSQFRAPTSPKIRTILDANSRRIFYNEAVSHVHSIYFDDPLLSGARENLEAPTNAPRVRLRWYDSPEAAAPRLPRGQTAHESDDRKDRLPIESSIPIAEMTYDELRDELARVLPPRFRETLLSARRTVLINSYHREHFGLEGTPIRITLDSEIECFDQAGLLRRATAVRRAAARPRRHRGQGAVRQRARASPRPAPAAPARDTLHQVRAGLPGTRRRRRAPVGLPDA